MNNLTTDTLVGVIATSIFLIVFMIGSVYYAGTRHTNSMQLNTAQCESKWFDYEWKVEKTNPRWDHYICMVKIDGKWTPEDNVKVGG